MSDDSASEVVANGIQHGSEHNFVGYVWDFVHTRTAPHASASNLLKPHPHRNANALLAETPATMTTSTAQLTPNKAYLVPKHRC